MLKQLIEQGLFEIYDEPMHWEDAIHASVAPLVKAGACTEQYAEVIIDRIKTHGPYIVLAPELALPHAEDCEHVSRSAVCFVKFNQPVSFAEEDPYDFSEVKTARLFFALTSEDEMQHLRNLRALTEECPRNSELVAKLCEATTKEEILAVLV